MTQLATIAPSRSKPVTSAAINQRIAGLLRAATVEVYEKNSPRVLDSYFAAGSDVYVSYLPGDDFHRRVEIAGVLRKAGYNPVLHVPARQMLSRDFLADYLGQAVEAGQVERVLLIAGDSTRGRGPYSTSLDLIASGVLQQCGIKRVDLAGHPEGNVGLSQTELMKILRDKRDAALAAGLQPAIVSQFSFDPRPIEQWLVSLHGEGFDLPIRLGLAGPANPATLLKFALRCGIGNSVSALQKHVGTIGRLLKDTGPDGVVRGLGDVLVSEAGRNVECFHFFPFGGLAKTSAWIETMLREVAA
jgi:methylenetetrahydrofolate reductase (NADPH)